MDGRVISNCRLATCAHGPGAYGRVDDGSLAMEAGMIAWVGSSTDLPDRFAAFPVEDMGGRLVTPALIDCHSHLVHGGNRAREFELRLQGASYEQIAREGGGILSTVSETRALSAEELAREALPRLDALLAEGLGTIEIKSGYGLTVESEIKMLRAARRLASLRPVRVVTTFLGAHAVPPDYSGNADGYIDDVCLPALRQAVEEGLVDAVDAFCEGIAFSPEQVARVFEFAAELGLPVKLHAEQLSDTGGAVLVARHGGLSADHLEYLGAEGVAALSESGAVATLLPGAFYFLRETKKPPVDSLRELGVPMAIATDSNPGSSPLTSLLLAMNMACVFFGLTAEEALLGVTREAAKSLGLGGEIGTLEPGKRADIAVWDVKDPAELSYRMGFNPLHKRVFGGAS